MRDDDLFRNFERMRRHIDEIFGDAWERVGLTGPDRRGFSPRVDVYYCGEPPMAVITADLPGIQIENVGLEVQGRKLIISGERAQPEEGDRIYQQMEIEHGFFRRIVELGADVNADEAAATYEDGLLKIKLPLATPERIQLHPVRESEGRS